MTRTPAREVYDPSSIALCSKCMRRVEAEVYIEEDHVVLAKQCPQHGSERVLLADDAAYWRAARERFTKPAQPPKRRNTEVRFGCPYDCGICSHHEQHACLAIVEICDACNLTCPVCYAESGPTRQEYRSLREVERMLDAVVANEIEPDIVQISGGEPTLHPDLFRILDLVRERPIRHLMLNTNGVKIGEDAEFAARLADLGPGFEVYLQFDSLEAEPLISLRGVDLRRTRERALENLDRYGVSTTLVATLRKGLNDRECGSIVDYALGIDCVRGVTFQPIQDAGRNVDFDPERDRLTLTEVRRKLLEQTSVFAPEDLIPVPCHPDCIAMGYALKSAGKVVPLTGAIDPDVLVRAGRSTIAYERDSELQRKLFDLFSTHNSPASGAQAMRELLCCLPEVEAPETLGYDNLFRVVIMAFLDAHSLEERTVRRSCVHFAHPDGNRLVPFDTYNLFYRGRLEDELLAPLRAEGTTV